MNAEASLFRPSPSTGLQLGSLHRAPIWVPGLWDKVPTLDGDNPDEDTDDSYEYELTAPHRIAPLPSGGVDPLRFAAWVLPPVLVLGAIAWVVWSVVK